MLENDETISALREALALSPDNSILRAQLARMLMVQGQLEQAESLLREGLDNHATSEVLQAALAECFRKRGNTSAALVVLEDLLKRPNCKPEHHIDYARLLLLKGQVDEAALAAALDVAPSPEVQQWQGKWNSGAVEKKRLRAFLADHHMRFRATNDGVGLCQSLALDFFNSPTAPYFPSYRR